MYTRRFISVIAVFAFIMIPMLLGLPTTVFAAEETLTIDDEKLYEALKTCLGATYTANDGAIVASDDTAQTITVEYDNVRVIDLKSVNMSSGSSKEIIEKLFLNCTQLHSVYLDSADMSGVDFSGLNNRGVTSLNLVKCSLTSVPDITLPNLQNLYISDNDFSAAGACDNLSVVHFPALQELYADDCMIADVSFLSLMSPDLTVLSLGRNRLTNDSLDIIISLKDGNLSKLAKLYIGGWVHKNASYSNWIAVGNTNKITDTVKMASLPTLFPDLRVMDLSGLDLTSLSDFAGISTVNFDFSHNKIVDFAGLENNRNNKIDTQNITLSGDFAPGQESELPELLKRILDSNDLLHGNLKYTSCKLSGDGTKLVVDPGADSAEVYVTNSALGNSTITIQLKKIPSYTIPQGLTAVVGDTLAKVTLPTGFTWKNTAQDVGAEGTNTFEAVYTPQDTNQYATVSVSIPVKVTDPNKPTEPTSSTNPTEPATNPTEPTSTAEPTEPVEPTEPATEPTSPIEPTKPVVEPTEPVTEPQPTKPVVEPTAESSEEYDDTDEEETKVAAAAFAAKTSDTSPVVPVTVLLLVSGVVLCITVLDKKKTM